MRAGIDTNVCIINSVCVCVCVFVFKKITMMPQPWKHSAQTMALTNYTVWSTCFESETEYVHAFAYDNPVPKPLKQLKVCARSRSKNTEIWDEPSWASKPVVVMPCNTDMASKPNLKLFIQTKLKPCKVCSAAIMPCLFDFQGSCNGCPKISPHCSPIWAYRSRLHSETYAVAFGHLHSGTLSCIRKLVFGN